MIWVTFEAIRQYFYCKRKIYFRYVMKFQGRTTYKMQKGAQYHIMKIKRVSKDSIANYWIQCHELGLRGYIDEIKIIDNKNCSLIDYKQKLPIKNRIPFQYKAQLIAEALAIEKCLGYKVISVIVKVPGGKRINETIKSQEISKVFEAINDIRTIIKSEIIPEPTRNEKKCTDCECKIVCFPF